MSGSQILAKDPQRVNIAGLMVDTYDRAAAVEAIRQRLHSNQKTFLVTPYSEFLYAAMNDVDVRVLLNSADISIPDGIAILLAHKFLSKPYRFKNYALQILEGWWQMFWLGWMLLLAPQKVYGPFAHKVVGADFVWDLVRLASEENKSVYILGGFGDTPEIVATKFKRRFPNLKIAGQSNKFKTDPTVVGDVKASRPDFLLVGFGPITQEKWIRDNFNDLPVALAVGLGGTFDYIAETRKAPPVWIRRIGLEWLYRLFTQPSRAGRIKTATFGLVNALIKYKTSV